MNFSKLKIWDKENHIMWPNVNISFIDLKSRCVWITQKGKREQWLKFDDVIFVKPTGLYDKNGEEIYEGDLVEYFSPYDSTTSYVGEVKFGSYMQDGSGGEYSPTNVVGIYLEALPGQLDEDGDEIVYDFDLTKSLAQCKTETNTEIVGSIYKTQANGK